MPNPLLSIIIPARNEEKFLPGCFASIDAAKLLFRRVSPSAEIEVVVVSNRSTDRTDQIARDYGALVVPSDAKNLSLIRNAGVRASSGEFVITIDADSRMSSNMLLAVTHELSNPKVVGGGVLIKPERLSLGIILTGVALLPWVLWLGISGGLFFFRRADFEAINGFDESLVSVEDIDFARRLKAHGKKTGRKFVNLFRASILTSCRKFDRFGDWFFLFHPIQFFSALRGKNAKVANKIWYDFER